MKQITFKTYNQKTILYTDDILRLEATVNFTIYHLTNGQQIRRAGNLKAHEYKLKTPTFFRIHRTHLINTKYFKAIVPSLRNTCVLMTSGEILPVSAIKIKRLQNYLIENKIIN